MIITLSSCQTESDTLHIGFSPDYAPYEFVDLTKSDDDKYVGADVELAKYIANLNIDTVDIGVPVLSMHAPFETTAKLDVYMCYKAMYEFMK